MRVGSQSTYSRFREPADGIFMRNIRRIVRERERANIQWHLAPLSPHSTSSHTLLKNKSLSRHVLCLSQSKSERLIRPACTIAGATTHTQRDLRWVVHLWSSCRETKMCWSERCYEYIWCDGHIGNRQMRHIINQLRMTYARHENTDSLHDINWNWMTTKGHDCYIIYLTKDCWVKKLVHFFILNFF